MRDWCWDDHNEKEVIHFSLRCSVVGGLRRRRGHLTHGLGSARCGTG